MGLRGRIVKWLDSFLTNRYIRVKVNGYFSKFKYVENGVPQGSVISPTLFNIAVSDLSDKITKTKITQFADDIALWKTNRNIKFTC
jgi:retron-type reverse transcriptase